MSSTANIQFMHTFHASAYMQTVTQRQIGEMAIKKINITAKLIINNNYRIH